MIQRLLGRYCDSIPKMFLTLNDSNVVRKNCDSIPKMFLTLNDSNVVGKILRFDFEIVLYFE